MIIKPLYNLMIKRFSSSPHGSHSLSHESIDVSSLINLDSNKQHI